MQEDIKEKTKRRTTIRSIIMTRVSLIFFAVITSMIILGKLFFSEPEDLMKYDVPVLKNGRSNIDLVYCWVNGSDKKFQDAKNATAAALNIFYRSVSNDARYVEHDELRYSMRSAATCVPWIHHIYIVTNGQVPTWLKPHPKVTIVTHDEIMPPTALPTFNSDAIEANIGKIKNLSEFFLYSNDDFFFYLPVKPSFFFTDDGKTIIRVVRNYVADKDAQRNIFFGNIKWSAALMRTKYPDSPEFEMIHNIIPYRKSSYLDCMNEFADEFNATSHKRFRGRNSTQRTMQAYYAILHNKGVSIRQVSQNGHRDSLYMNVQKEENMYSMLMKAQPKILCINDQDSADPNDRANLGHFLQRIYPRRALWEKIRY